MLGNIQIYLYIHFQYINFFKSDISDLLITTTTTTVTITLSDIILSMDKEEIYYSLQGN